MLKNTNLYKLYLESKESGDNYKLSTRAHHDEEIFNELKYETTFLPDDATVSERLYCYIHDIHHILLCPYCHKNKLKYTGKLNKGYYSTCGNNDCKHIGITNGAKNRTTSERKQAAAKGKLTHYERTGFYNNMQNPDELAKWQNSFKMKYGVTSPLKNEMILNKAKSTMLEHFGTLDILHLEKSIGTIRSRYGSIANMNKEAAIKRGAKLSILRKEEIESKITSYEFSIIEYNNDMFTLKCDKCGHIFSISRQGVNTYSREAKRWCPKCDYKNMTFRSKIEKTLADDIKSFYIGEIQYNKHFGKYEVDIYIPEHKLAVEVNGLYWHSDIYHNKYYHIDKKKNLAELGIDLVYVWEDEINDHNKKEIILSRLASKLGLSKRIYARKCNIVKYTKDDVKLSLRTFLDNNHLQGFCAGSSYYGLEYKNEIVELIVIGKKRKLMSSEKYKYELIRLCTKKNLEIVGGFSKLLKHAMSDLNIESLISYVDLSWSSLNKCSYVSIGFNFIKITEPSYWWAGNCIRYNRLNFTKSKLIKDGYNKNKTEDEIMKYDKKYLKIWGPGNMLVEYKI